MAAESASTLVPQVPEFVQWTAWTIIAVVGGLAVRFGWFNAKSNPPTTTMELAGGLVDNKALKAFTESVDDAVDRYTELHEERMRHERKQMQILESLDEDVRHLTKALIRVLEKSS